MDTPPLSQLVTKAISRLHLELEQTAPVMGEAVFEWMRHLGGTAEPADYFNHPLAFPALLLPWWLEKTIRRQPDLQLQADLTYSTINGYYHVRLIDNLMDGDATVELGLLPALGFFHTQFQMAYQPYFASDHPFWTFFTATWFHSAEVTLKDAHLTEIEAAQFEQVSAQKVCAAKIPLAAVCYRHRRPDLIEPWSRLVDLFGCWHQMFNDLFDWHKDEAGHNRTYFLSEAKRRQHEGEPLISWVAREGFDWAIGKLQAWMLELKRMAHHLNSPDLSAYLDQRETMLLTQQEAIAPGLHNLARIVAGRNKDG
jgi:hypothetical protein